jgi:hypothetical protein
MKCIQMCHFFSFLSRKIVIFCLGLLGFKEFLFRMAQTIISMFALRTRAAHLLLECPLDTLRCALTASRSSLGRESGEFRMSGKRRKKHADWQSAQKKNHYGGGRGVDAD